MSPVFINGKTGEGPGVRRPETVCVRAYNPGAPEIVRAGTGS
jgi:hypothetical protein